MLDFTKFTTKPKSFKKNNKINKKIDIVIGNQMYRVAIERDIIEVGSTLSN